jgi:hypothetical protein
MSIKEKYIRLEEKYISLEEKYISLEEKYIIGSDLPSYHHNATKLVASTSHPSLAGYEKGGIRSS